MICPGGVVLRGLVSDRDVGVQLGRERPRLRPVHHHLNEPHRRRVGAQSAAGLTGVRVQAGDPRLVPVTGQRGQLDHWPVRAGGVPPCDAAPFGEVVVIGAGSVRVQIVPGSRRGPAVYLDPTVHLLNHFQ
jgi:hypothetical protein